MVNESQQFFVGTGIIASALDIIKSVKSTSRAGSKKRFRAVFVPQKEMLCMNSRDKEAMIPAISLA